MRLPTRNRAKDISCPLARAGGNIALVIFAGIGNLFFTSGTNPPESLIDFQKNLP
jgi:hypothetical protein